MLIGFLFSGGQATYVTVEPSQGHYQPMVNGFGSMRCRRWFLLKMFGGACAGIHKPPIDRLINLKVVCVKRCQFFLKTSRVIEDD